MCEVFPVMRNLHELLRYIAEALDLHAARPLRRDLRRAHDRLDAMTRATAQSLLAIDVMALRAEVNPLLLRASELARASVPGKKKDHRNADLMGKRMARAKLRGASMRGAYLIAADLRDANLCGADLTGALFLTRPSSMPLEATRRPGSQRRCSDRATGPGSARIPVARSAGSGPSAPGRTRSSGLPRRGRLRRCHH